MFEKGHKTTNQKASCSSLEVFRLLKPTTQYPPTCNPLGLTSRFAFENRKPGRFLIRSLIRNTVVALLARAWPQLCYEIGLNRSIPLKHMAKWMKIKSAWNENNMKTTPCGPAGVVYFKRRCLDVDYGPSLKGFLKWLISVFFGFFKQIQRSLFHFRRFGSSIKSNHI